MATKLNGLLAVEKGAKNNYNDSITSAYHRIEKLDLFAGISRVYEPKDEDGDVFPAESTLVQTSAEDLFEKTAKTWGRLLDVVASKDNTNQAAKADIKVGDIVIATNVPVTYLVWLEKQLVDLHTFVRKMPVLDQAFVWSPAPNVGEGIYATPVVQTFKSKKIPKSFEKSPATDKHPAQVETYYEDVVVGTWNTTKFSGALPQARIDELKEKVELLQDAVKLARETANSIDVVDLKIGDPIFDYLLN